MVEHLYYIWVPSHHPCVQKGIPVYRVFVSQPGIQRIRIGQDVRVEKMIEAERSVGFARGRLRCHGHKLIPSWDDSRNESKSLPRWNEFPGVWAVLGRPGKDAIDGREQTRNGSHAADARTTSSAWTPSCLTAQGPPLYLIICNQPTHLFVGETLDFRKCSCLNHRT